MHDNLCLVTEGIKKVLGLKTSQHGEKRAITSTGIPWNISKRHQTQIDKVPA